MSTNNGNTNNDLLNVLLQSVTQTNALIAKFIASQDQSVLTDQDAKQDQTEKIRILKSDQDLKVTHLCQAISKTTGEQCKLSARSGSKFCHVHAKQDQNFDQSLEDQIQVLKVEDQIKILGSDKNDDPDRMRVNTDRKAINFLFSKKRRGFPQQVMAENFWINVLNDLKVGERQDILGNRSVKPLITNLSWKNKVKVNDDLSFKIGKKTFKIFWETKKQATEKNQQYFRQYIERVA